MTDCVTGLMWEVKDSTCAAGDVHCVTNTYTWTFSGSTDGTLYTTFLPPLNADVVAAPLGTAPTGCFAQHCDWRIPTLAELRSILTALYPLCTTASPCIDPAFGPTADTYWSSSSLSGNTPPRAAWLVSFSSGSFYFYDKFNGNYAARAVRGGR